jgi:hypothetical protein
MKQHNRNEEQDSFIHVTNIFFKCKGRIDDNKARWLKQ